MPHAALALTLAVALAVPLTVAGSAPASADEQQLPNTDFAAGADPWWVTPDLEPADTSSGALCVEVPGGTSTAWASIVGIDGIAVTAGESYRLAFRTSGTAPATIRALVQQDSAPWAAAYEANPTMASGATAYEYGFTAAMDIPAGQLVFQIGGAEPDWTFCLDDVSFGVGEPPEPYAAETTSAVRANQLGYLPDGPKRATVLSDEPAPLPWVLRDGSGAEVASGRTEPRGDDRTAGSGVHVIDFSDAGATGDGFTLAVGDDASLPFRIAADLYENLPGDALGYFYLARSGIAIDGDLVGAPYARDAGHIGIAPNQGDLAVGCQQPRPWTDGWTCDYTLDVTGGWYDAGDHGKYVVNGGVSVHQLLDIAERAGLADPATTGRYGDGTMRIPEAGNGVPDLLDEVRWELEWMLKMQVPAGLPLAGMVHHKVQNDGWTGLPLLPADDPRPRQLHRPSTAATLNLAAAAAKGARLFAEYDAAFADRLTAAARTAWASAHETPDLFAPRADGDDGGGPYDDQDVSDEFYWAAAELWLTTRDEAFAEAIEVSAAASAPIYPPVAFDWGATTMLGHIDLARAHAQGVDAPGGQRAHDAIVATADALLRRQAGTHFGQPYDRTDGTYEWGSNSIIVNNAAVLATAHDLTGDRAYRDGAIEAMDHILGRNALEQSYVTGYGTTFSQNQHSRWLAAQLDPALPHPPVGTLAGGPNSQIQDPVAARTWPDGCPAQLCYLDDIQSWSTNEMTINWNAALAWMGAWLADQSAGTPPGAAAVGGGADGLAWPVWGAIALVALALAVAVALGVRARIRRRAERHAPSQSATG